MGHSHCDSDWLTNIGRKNNIMTPQKSSRILRNPMRNECSFGMQNVVQFSNRQPIEVYILQSKIPEMDRNYWVKINKTLLLKRDNTIWRTSNNSFKTMTIVKSSHILHSILYSANIITKQRQTFLKISATSSNILASTARLLDGFSMSGQHY